MVELQPTLGWLWVGRYKSMLVKIKSIAKNSENILWESIAVWNLQGKVLYILFLFINCVLHIPYIGKIYNKFV